MSIQDLSPEEREVNHLINESKTRIDGLQERINNLQRDRGYDARYEMGGGLLPNDPGANAKARQEALAAIEKEKEELAAKVDKALSESSPQIRAQGYRNLTSYLYPDKANEGERGKQKDVEASQAFAMKLRYASKEDGPVIPDHERAREKDLSPSQDFANKLLAKEAADQSRTVPITSGQLKYDKTQELSMSGQFSQTLKYTQLEKEEAASQNTSRDQKDQGREIEKDRDPD